MRCQIKRVLRGNSAPLLKVITALAMFVLSLRTYSDEVPNFTATDIHGDTHELYEMLDSGKHVWIHFTGKF